MLLSLLGLISTSVSAQLTVGNYFRYNGFVYQVDAMATATTGSVSVAAIQTDATPIDASGKLNLIGVIDDNFLGEHIVLTVTHIQANALRTCANPAFNAAAIGTTTAFPEDKIVTVKKVEIPAQFTQVLATTFEGYTNIDEITFATGSQLNLVESHAFTTTQVKEFDFSPCTLLYNLADEAFVKSNTTPNNYITKITLPDHSGDATMTRFSFGENLTVGGGIVSATGTALSYLPKLATIVNLDKCNLRQIKASAFNGDASLTSLEVPATVNLIEDGAFANSGIKNLTINVGNLGATLTYDVNGTPTATVGSFGQGTGNLYGATPEVLESLTLKGVLNTTILANAFNGCVNLENLDMINMSFKETTTTPVVVGAGAFAANSFRGCTSLTSVMIPVIKGNGAAGTVIAGGAFAGCTALADVNITGIKTDAGAVAVGGAAFGTALKTVTIGTIEVAATTNEPIAAGAFVYGDVSGATLKIATGASQYLNNSGAVDLIAAGAFDFSAITVTPARTEADYPTVQIGQINSGAIFADAALNGDQIMSITFTGTIDNGGLDGFTAPIIDNTGTPALKELTFKGNLGTGTTAAAVIGANAFALLPNLETITFDGDIIPGAIAGRAFDFTGSTVAKVTITFNGDLKASPAAGAGAVVLAGAFDMLPATSEIHYTKDGATVAFNPFAATAFDNTTPAVVGTARDIVLVVTDAALAALYADGTNGLSTGNAWDIFRVIASAAPVVTTSLNVYVNNSNPAQAWAREAVTATGTNFKAITRVQTIDGVGEVKVTLYGTYADEDPYDKQSTVYMVPLKAIGGVYYIDANTETLIAKVEKTDASAFTADFAIPMVDLTAAAAATAQQVVTAASSIWTGLTNDKLHIAGNIMTNQDLCDGNAVDSSDGYQAGAWLYRWIDNTVKTDIVRNIYFMTDPSKHNGFRVKLTEINRTNSNYIGTGNYYMLLAKFNSDSEARVIWLGEDENVTAILGVKKNVKSVDNDAVYTLQGVRVDEIQKGHVYIKNGKKFIAQ